MTARISFQDVLHASAKRLRLGVAGPNNADQLDEIAVKFAELIEAARPVALWMADCPARERLRAALEGVGDAP